MRKVRWDTSVRGLSCPRKGKPKHELFAKEDGLHPNGVGTNDLQSFFQ